MSGPSFRDLITNFRDYDAPLPTKIRLALRNTATSFDNARTAAATPASLAVERGPRTLVKGPPTTTTRPIKGTAID
jgi:hypothetical protein